MHREDPLEEMAELYQELKDCQTKFRKVLEVCGNSTTITIVYSFYN
jgi:hypothetical protein